MSFQECTQLLRDAGTLRINAAEFSMEELEAAAALAQSKRARLIIDNLKGRSCADVGRIADAGGRQVTFGDIYLL
jgi:predicted transcriptional regulator